MPYLPRWDKGKEIGTGQRDGDGRYRAIRKYLEDNPIEPGFSVLDFGAWNGYFSRRLADDLGANCTAVDNVPELEPYPGVAVINRRIQPDEITGTYDVVIAMSVLHHLENWRDYLAKFLEVAPVVFLEVAAPNEVLPKAKAHNNSKAIMRAVKAKKLGGTVIAETPGYDSKHLRPLIVIDQRENRPSRTDSTEENRPSRTDSTEVEANPDEPQDN